MLSGEMMNVLVRVIACFLMLFVSASSWAQSGEEYPSLDKPAKVEKSGSKDVAVIVAIEDYAFLPPVRGAVANGNDWETFFRRGLGVSTVHVVSNRAATNDEMRRFAAMAAKDVGKGGTVWFVFIGHGAPDAERADGILVGMDAQQTTTSLVTRGLLQQELLEILGKGKQKQTVLVVDACFSGRDTAGNALVEAQPVLPVNFQPKMEEKTTVILSAAQAREFAGPLPGASRPAFSYLLLGALRGWAEDGKGQVSANDALWFTQKSLRGIPGRFDQTPSLHGNGNLVLVRGVREKDPGVRSLMERKLRQPIATETTVRPTLGENPTVGRTSLEKLDLEELRQLEAVSQAIREAEALDTDTKATVTARAAAWERAAALAVKGGNPYATDARARAARWREVAAAVTRMRPEWRTLQELLGMQVVSVAEKRRKLDEFLAAYGALGGEPELVAAREALARLEQGGQAVQSGGTTQQGRAPKGFVKIPAGRFTQGSPSSEYGHDDNEVQREVTISRAFLLKATEVTQGEWRALMGNNPSHFSACGDDCPVENVSWFDAVDYLNRLSTQEGFESCYAISGESVTFKGLSCKGYRLPTEAEWEYAARAGTTGATYGALSQTAWYADNSGKKTHAVGQKQANAWGLYDMLGNVWEWTGDWYGNYGSGPATDPVGPATGSFRVARGCSWPYVTRFCRAALRNYGEPAIRNRDVGFRPARSIP